MIPVFQRWQKIITSQVSSNTLYSYSSDILSFINFISTYKEIKKIQNLDLQNIKVIDIRAWLSFKKNSSRSNARALSALRNFYSYLKEHHNINSDAPFKLKFRYKLKKIPRHIEHVNITNSFEYLKKDNQWTKLRDRAILFLLYGCGLRISEALNLSKNSFEDNYIRVIGKGNKQRLVPLLPQILESINLYNKSCPHDTSQFLFVGKKGGKLNRTAFANNIRNLRNELMMPENTTPHAFRHSFATELINNGVGIRIIQELLGHADVSTTDLYTNVHKEMLFSEYKKCHPKNKGEI